MLIDELKKFVTAVEAEKGRTPYLEIAQGALKTAVAHLENHASELKRQTATEAEAIQKAEKDLAERKARLAGQTTGGSD